MVDGRAIVERKVCGKLGNPADSGCSAPAREERKRRGQLILRRNIVGKLCSWTVEWL